ncbi:hypothetical protein ACMFFK_10205 [Serratia marcescens]|uniref:hypothetical protein n=1 Tax=Serratia TaxID=613 RepID=UPI0006685487|nr:MULTISPECIES: hypothetical protein [Serratia]MDU0859303.1 hypothetical protein [Serratia marcescens]POX19347.1 hypothetical protein C3468_15320 [Serratia marcescens]HAX9713578.1 hypothetical protein [Serratia marcescens]HEJ7902503.1 hypothetical protein [Serratia marcescens]
MTEYSDISATDNRDWISFSDKLPTVENGKPEKIYVKYKMLIAYEETPTATVEWALSDEGREQLSHWAYITDGN